jgi:cytochrome c556
MSKHVRVPVAALLLALSFALSGAARSPDDEEDEALKKAVAAAQGPVLKLAQSTDAKDFDKMAQQLTKDHKMAAVMRQFKPRIRGGIGIGEVPGAITPDNIELKIIKWSEKAPTKMELTKFNGDFVKMGQVVRAIAEATPYWAPTEKKPGKDPKDWMKYSETMKKSADDLIAALREKEPDPKKIQTIVTKLHSSCTDCHGKFRDNPGGP